MKYITLPEFSGDGHFIVVVEHIRAIYQSPSSTPCTYVDCGHNEYQTKATLNEVLSKVQNASWSLGR